MSMDLTASACDMGRAIAAGQLDPVDLTEAMLEAARGAQGIYARMTETRARAEALAARGRARDGVRRDPLDGVPISWKDLFDTAHVATEAGTAMLRGRVPQIDAELLGRATRAGLVCLGKTHMTELAFSGLGINPVTATPPNRHDPDLAPGGSSSGAAASVAFGMAAAGIGSDTGGSVRVPAVWNDLVGFKTSVGSLPMAGVVPLCARFDTIGPLCRSVEDAAAIYAVLSATRPVAIGAGAASVGRFLVLENPAIEPVDAAPQAAFDAAVARLEASGARVDRAVAPGLDAAMKLSAILFATEAYGTWGHLIETQGAVMYPRVRQRFEAGRAVSGPDYVAGWQTLDRCRAEFLAAVASYDAVLLPTCPILPPRVPDLLADEDLFIERNLLALRNTRVGNLMNLTGVTLPTGAPHCGLMMLCPAGQERRALVLASAVEKSL